MRQVLGAILLLIGGPIQATIVTVDFEGIVADNESLSPDLPYIEDGMSIVSATFFNLINGKDFSISNGSAVFNWCAINLITDCVDDLITLTNNDGGTFDLLSLDSSATAVFDPLGLTSVTGYYAGGGSISTEIALVEDVWNTFSFDTQWSNLVSVEIHGNQVDGDYNISIDNIVVNVIPIPAAVWLFGSGLGLLGWMRRKVSQ